MQITTPTNTPTSTTIQITLDGTELEPIKSKVLLRMSRSLKVSGFRPGKVPKHLAEKYLQPEAVFEAVVKEAVGMHGDQALADKKITPATQPEIEVVSFTPYSELTFTVATVHFGPVTLPELSTLKVSTEESKVTTQDIDDVLERLQIQHATKQDSTEPAMDGDEVWIDFDGFDAKGEAIEHADGKNYPLALGSNTFIPGFEENLLGKKIGDEFEFEITFPKDYQSKELAGKKATFKVKVLNIQKVIRPDLTDEFADSISPTATIRSLRLEIKEALKNEKDKQNQRAIENEAVSQLVEKSTVEVPEMLIEQQIERLESNEKRDLANRGITWEQHLTDEGLTQEEHREKKTKPEAIRFLKSGIVLTELSQNAKITISKDEMQQYLSALRAQYQGDPRMQQELANPNNRQEIAARLLTDKTVDYLVKEIAKK